MKTGVIADVHGNLEALQAVLAALAQSDISDIVCAGDIVGYGADPGACIELVRNRCRVVVAGNHDHACVARLPLDYFNAAAKAAVAWTTSRLTDSERWWLSNLPLVHCEDLYCIVHGSFDEPEAFTYIFDPEDAVPSFEKQPTLLGFFGHTHWPVTLIDGEPVTHSLQQEVPVVPPAKMMVNVGSVGQPRDSNAAASYVVFDGESRLVEFHRVGYDVEEAASKIRQAGLPVALAERLFWGY